MLVNEQLSIHLVKLPLPFRLNHVNCYAVQGSGGWSLIDTGLNNEATHQAWLEFFTAQNIKPTEINSIYLTHFHPDHYGAAGWLQQLTGAPIYLGEIDYDRVNRYWKNPEDNLAALATLFLEHGMPQEITDGVIEAMGKLIPMTFPHGEVTVLTPGQMVEIGDNPYKAVLTPGHTDGHLCYFNETSGVLFSGDHLLPKISSNISLWPQKTGIERDPLANFLEALREIDRLDCKLVLPAHGHAFDTVHQRVEQLLAHHEERLAQVKTVCGEGQTGYQVCRQVFTQELSMHELRFAMAETLAHLMHLQYRDQVEQITKDGALLFRMK